MMAVVEKLIQKPIHPWNLKPEKAMALQTKLSVRVIRKSRIKIEDVVNIAGVDTAYRKGIAYAAVVVMSLLTDTPSIGCAKTKLVGNYIEPPPTRGGISYLTDGKENIGAVVRTRVGVKPVFISTGHLMDLNDSIQMVLKSSRGYRLPEPLRSAHHLSGEQITSSG